MDNGIELTLCLSTNGKFGVDPVRTNNKLKRSCSTLSNLQEPEPVAGPGFTLGGEGLLARTCSMPVDAEEEARKRKEWQMFRRREAKRRMSEKIRSFGAVSKKEEDAEEEEEDKEESLPKIVSQRSSGSSGLTEFESQMTPPHGINKIGEARSPQSVESFSEQNEQRPEPVNREVKPARSISAPNVMEKSLLAEMPCVSTKGDGPNGKRVDGFLYRYKKGEEVKILCVCHGSFLSPAEFVKHGGGGDVEHPLRRIVVNPSPSL